MVKQLIFTLSFLVASASLIAQEKDTLVSDELDASELAKASQNPLNAMYSLPFQNNTTYANGKYKRAQNVMNVQPVIPINLGKKLIVINRIIVPIITQPSTLKDKSNTNIGDVLYTAWFGPSKKSVLSWGAGPVFQIPTGSDANEFGSREFGVGPSVVVLATVKKWVMGVVAQNIWTFKDIKENKFLIQYFVNFNLPKAWYIVTGPILTANWNADKGQKWVIPFGLGFGKLIKIGKLPINLSAHAYYNVVRPDGVGGWQSRFQLQFLFPTKKKK